MEEIRNVHLAATEILVQAKKDIEELFSKVDPGVVGISIRQSLQNSINKLNFATGTALNSEVQPKFEPVTDFMGDKLITKEPVKTEDLSPKELERKLFVDKVDKLYAAFDNLEDDQILDSYSQPENQIVLRGVAKRAGLENYKSGEINAQFVSDIRSALEELNEAAAKKKETEGKLTVAEDEDEDDDSLTK